jgi:2-polyprenyl-6-methoxyphenol hydroxylase-like FAD-dependent oxidoreductase
MLGAGVRVLVVGAGIAGLAAARTLRNWGAAVEIVERQLDPPGEGTGIYLLGNAVRAPCRTRTDRDFLTQISGQLMAMKSVDTGGLSIR